MDITETHARHAGAIDVLVVDDDPAVATEAADCLQRAGLSCLGVQDGWQALGILMGGRPVGIVVSDLRMPALDGLQFAEHLNALPGPRRPELIFISGNAGFDDAVQAIRLNARDLLTKPVAPAALIRSVKSALLARQMRAPDDREAAKPDTDGEESPEHKRAMLESLRAERRVRSQYFPSELFSDPCWEMLLDLYDGLLGAHQVTVTSLAAASGAAMTTAWRRISALQSHGLIERSDDPQDKRRAIVRLSASGCAAVERFLESYSRRRTA